MKGMSDKEHQAMLDKMKGKSAKGKKGKAAKKAKGKKSVASDKTAPVDPKAFKSAMMAAY